MVVEYSIFFHFFISFPYILNLYFNGIPQTDFPPQQIPNYSDLISRGLEEKQFAKLLSFILMLFFSLLKLLTA